MHHQPGLFLLLCCLKVSTCGSAHMRLLGPGEGGGEGRGGGERESKAVFLMNPCVLAGRGL